MSLEDFLRALEERDVRKWNARGLCFQFGRRASQEDLKRLFLLLAGEADEKKIKPYLWVFWRGGIPGSPEAVFAHASSSDAQVRIAAVGALAGTRHPSVRAFAVDALNAGRLDALELFARNYEDGDFKFIEAKLRPTGDKDEMHSICRDLLQICEEHNSAAPAGCLIWVYEHTPCANCRDSAVEKLLATGSLPTAFAEECCFDCEKETRSSMGLECGGN